MAQNTVKTIHHVKQEILRSMGLPFVIDDYSTLNEKHSIGNIQPPAGEYPVIKYMGIGRGGHRNVTGADNTSLTDILRHGVTDAVLFEQIPFVLVLTTDDISVPDRAKYRIRVLETHGGTDYFAYYLKVIEEVATDPDSRVVVLENGVIITDDPYVPVISSQNPSPVDLSNVIENTVEGRHLTVQSKVNVDFNTVDISRFLDAIQIIYGDVRYATISEIAIVSGFDISVTSTIGGMTVVHDEIRTGQVVNFIGTEVPLQHNPISHAMTYGLGNSMPLPPVVA